MRCLLFLLLFYTCLKKISYFIENNKRKLLFQTDLTKKQRNKPLSLEKYIENIEFYSKQWDQVKHRISACDLYLIYKYGIGIEIDLNKSIQIIESASDNGDPEAMFTLGCIHKMGSENIPKNVRKSFELCKKASETGNVIAILNVAIFYEKGGEGIEKDLNKAIQLYETLSKMKLTQAMVRLCSIYKKQLEDYERCASYCLQISALNIDKKKYETTLMTLIHEKRINWKVEYHSFWDHSNILDQKIMLILLISKHRKEFKNFDNCIFLKGISLLYIKNLCNISQK